MVEARVEAVESQAIVTATVQSGQKKFAATIIQNDTKCADELTIWKNKVRDLKAELKEEAKRRDQLETVVSVLKSPELTLLKTRTAETL